jgi:hypothetical protein
LNSLVLFPLCKHADFMNNPQDIDLETAR